MQRHHSAAISLLSYALTDTLCDKLQLTSCTTKVYVLYSLRDFYVFDAA